MFGGRQRSATAPFPVPAARPPPLLSEEPPVPAAPLPYPHAEFVRGRPPSPIHVPMFHMRNAPRGNRIAQATDNVAAAEKVHPSQSILVQNPNGSILYGGERDSRQVQSAKRTLERVKGQTYSKGGLVKSYGVGSSSLPRPREPGDFRVPRLNTEITAELNMIDSELRRLVADKRRLLPRSNDPVVMRQIQAIDRTLGDLRNRKIFIMVHYPGRD